MIRVQLKKKRLPRLQKRLKSRARIRKKVSGSAERPRLSVFRSLKHIYAQLIDDEKGCVLAAASSLNLKKEEKATKTDLAGKTGEAIAAAASKKKIQRAVFDRGGFIYHGRVKALAEGARRGGLKF